MYIWKIYRARFPYKIIHFNYPILQSGVHVLRVIASFEVLIDFRVQFWSQNNIVMVLVSVVVFLEGHE